ncbi:MAG: sigma-70 family RNA polymerase sigma factor [Gemmataceae bacterium]
MNTTQLNTWLGRMRNGDDTARDELLRSVQERLEAQASAMLKKFPRVKRWEDTGDVLNAALVRLMRALEQVDPFCTRDFYALASTQIRRELLDLVRHYYGARGHGANYQSFPRGENARTPPEELLATENDQEELMKWAAFHEAVEKLPIEEREVLSLIFYHGWTQAEIAEFFGVSRRTVMRRYANAAVNVRELVQATSTIPNG